MHHKKYLPMIIYTPQIVIYLSINILLMENWTLGALLGVRYLFFFSFSTNYCRNLETFLHILVYPFKLWYVRVICMFIFVSFLSCIFRFYKLLQIIFHSKANIRRNWFTWSNITIYSNMLLFLFMNSSPFVTFL